MQNSLMKRAKRVFDWSKPGLRFGRLTFVKVGKYLRIGSREAYCRCDCGNMKKTSTHCLTSGDAVSCGCYNKERLDAVRTKHGFCTRKKRRPEYFSWRNMLSRCYDPLPRYARYKEKGIVVCRRWRFGEGGVHPFVCFITDMGMRPKGKRSIGRINNNGNYTPKNCRWEDHREQGNNRYDTPMVRCRGKKIRLVDALPIVGLKKGTVWARITRGWPAKDILLPVIPKHENRESIRKRCGAKNLRIRQK